MLALFFATLCAGIFCGAALYINLVEHPARVACGTEVAVRQFAPSYKRATVMQVSLVIGGLLFGLTGAWQLRDPLAALGAILLAIVVPFTLIGIFPTNKQLLDPTLDARSERAAALLARWNRLHAVRSVLSAAGFTLMLWRLAFA
jgi:Zn-dependent membrane protease YugP